MTIWTPEIKAAAGPKYLAIAAALASDIQSGRLKPGDRLPPQRELAQALGVDLTTVTRAYAVVQRDGLIAANSRRGSVVRGTPSPASVEASDLPPIIVDQTMNLPPQPPEIRLAERMRDAVAEILSGADGLSRLQYQPAGGALRDRILAARHLSRRIPGLTEDRVLLASGAQHALMTIAAMLFQPGDTILTAGLIYPGMKSIAAKLGLNLLPIADASGGLDVENLASAASGKNVRGLYCVPAIDNPTTMTLDSGMRQAIADVANRFGLTILEDDAYGGLLSKSLQPLAVLAPERTWYIATLAKTLTPGLRIAYVAAPDVGGALRAAAEFHGSSIMAPPLSAAIAGKWMADGTADEMTAAIRRENVERQAILRAFVPGADLRADPEGPHAWLSLPKGWDRRDFSAMASRAGLAVLPSDPFTIGGEPPQSVRLSLGSLPNRDDVSRAARLLHALLAGLAADPSIV